jgi:hypothetical protein
MSKIKIQGNASGTGVVTLIAPNTNTDKTITLPDSTATLVGSDASGNVGIGVVPSTSWDSGGESLSIGDGTLVGNGGSGGGHWTSSNNAVQSTNNYTTGWVYQNTDEVSQHVQVGGTHLFRVAPSGTAGSAISWTTAMTIRNSGDIYLSDNISTNAYTDTSGTGSLKIQGHHSSRNRSIVMSSDTSAGWSMAYLNAIDGADNERFTAFLRNGTQIGSIQLNGTTGTHYLTSSDYRLKENVVPMTGSIDRLKALKPSKFNFITEPDRTVDGFLAHEAQAIVPECASGTKDAMKTEEYEVTPAVMDGETVVTEAVMGEREVPDMQGIDQAKLVPLLVGAIQELTARLEALEAN